MGGERMTDEEINKAIAEICGWKIHPANRSLVTDPKYPKSVQRIATIPNYCNDLNAMHEAEKFILKGFEDDAEGSELWQDYMVYVVCAAPAYLSHHATARQKAKAFLQTFGKWEERG
jgi:hypothetical protein